MFIEDLNSENPMKSANNEITILYAKLLHEMWNKEKPLNTYGSDSFNPHQLKKAIGNKNSLFKGFSQHDSNELI
jgi:uncharacterized UBP type Zn finger protein